MYVFNFRALLLIMFNTFELFMFHELLFNIVLLFNAFDIRVFTRSVTQTFFFVNVQFSYVQLRTGYC